MTETIAPTKGLESMEKKSKKKEKEEKKKRKSIEKKKRKSIEKKAQSRESVTSVKTNDEEKRKVEKELRKIQKEKTKAKKEKAKAKKEKEKKKKRKSIEKKKRKSIEKKAQARESVTTVKTVDVSDAESEESAESEGGFKYWWSLGYDGKAQTKPDPTRRSSTTNILIKENKNTGLKGILNKRHSEPIDLSSLELTDHTAPLSMSFSSCSPSVSNSRRVSFCEEPVLPKTEEQEEDEREDSTKSWWEKINDSPPTSPRRPDSLLSCLSESEKDEISCDQVSICSEASKVLDDLSCILDEDEGGEQSEPDESDIEDEQEDDTLCSSSSSSDDDEPYIPISRNSEKYVPRRDSTLECNLDNTFESSTFDDDNDDDSLKGFEKKPENPTPAINSLTYDPDDIKDVIKNSPGSLARPSMSSLSMMSSPGSLARPSTSTLNSGVEIHDVIKNSPSKKSPPKPDRSSIVSLDGVEMVRRPNLFNRRPSQNPDRSSITSQASLDGVQMVHRPNLFGRRPSQNPPLEA